MAEKQKPKTQTTEKKVEAKKPETKKPVGKGRGRTGAGLIAKARAEYAKGNKDFEKIAKSTGARLSTVKTQYYRWNAEKKKKK